MVTETKTVDLMDGPGVRTFLKLISASIAVDIADEINSQKHQNGFGKVESVTLKKNDPIVGHQAPPNDVLELRRLGHQLPDRRWMAFHYWWFIVDAIAIPILPDVDVWLHLRLFLSWTVENNAVRVKLEDILPIDRRICTNNGDEDVAAVECNCELNLVAAVVQMISVFTGTLPGRSVFAASFAPINLALQNAMDQLIGMPNVIHASVRVDDVFVGTDDCLKAQITYQIG